MQTSLSHRADTMNQLVLSTLLLLLLLPGQLARACPTGCQCQDPMTILCAARRGHTVPRGLPPSTLSLYVFENGITMLSEDSFAGLPALQLLDLSQNKITSIQKNIFQPLTELVNLDLSSNSCRRSPTRPSTGCGCWSGSTCRRTGSSTSTPPRLTRWRISWS